MSQWPPPPAPGSDPSSTAAMAQCTVTGTWHPTDELVNFQGQLVSAEGKQILLDRIMSGEAPAFFAGRPSVLRRFGCIFLDWLIVMIPIFVFDFAWLGTALMHPPNQLANLQQNARPFINTGLLSLITGFGFTAYFALLHARNGQTIGKRVGHLRVVNLDGTTISTRTAWLRAFAYTGPNLVTSFGYIIFASVLSFNAFMITNSIMSFAVFGWALAEIILALTDTQRQRTLHDRIAGTRVIHIGA